MKQSGFVLLMVLIMISIMSLIGMYTLTLDQNEQRISRQMLMAYQREYNHIAILTRLEQRLLDSSPPCVVEAQGVSRITTMPLSWWELNGCFEPALSIRYIYVVEDAGKDDCAVVSASNDVAHYYRINLLIRQNTNSARWLILQSVIVKADNRQQPCQHVEHSVSVGRQGMRWISHKGMNNEADT